MSSEIVGRGRLFAYGIAETPIAMAAIPVSLFLPAFYTGELGLGLASVGLILMLARFWDVITDPLIGYLSDRTRTRFGRRRPWIIVSVPLVILAVYKLFIPTEPVSELYLLGWIMLLWLGWTLFNIPYFAWGAELSPNYEQRTRITGWRTILGLVGTLLAVGVPALSQGLFDFGGRSGEAMYLVGIGAMVLIPICVGTLVVSVPERQTFAPAQLHAWDGLKIMWGNGPFKRLILAFACSTMGTSLAAPLFVMFISHVVGDPTAAPKVVVAHFIANIIGVPFWVWLAKKTDKHVSWLASLFIMATVFPTFMLLEEGDLVLAAVLLFLIGIGAGNFSVVPSSMKADVIDLDRIQSGEDRAGLFFAAWSTATKLVSALGVGIAFPTLAWLGFDPKIENGPDEIFALQAFYSFVPIVFYLFAAALVWRYPITREHHEEIRQQID